MQTGSLAEEVGEVPETLSGNMNQKMPDVTLSLKPAQTEGLRGPEVPENFTRSLSLRMPDATLFLRPAPTEVLQRPLLSWGEVVTERN